MNATEHWEKIYRENDPAKEVSWHQPQPTVSLKLITATGIAKTAAILDVGAGASVLVDYLLHASFRNVAVLDISGAAIEFAQRRLGARATEVTWFDCDIAEFNPSRPFALWHDRALFHFFTDADARRKYVRVLKRTLLPDGHVIIGTFATNGPTRCCGLEVVRYSAAAICAELGDEFQLLEQFDETHVTPWNSEQKFAWFRFQRGPGSTGQNFNAVPPINT